MKSIGVTLQRTYLTKNCKNQYLRHLAKLFNILDLTEDKKSRKLLLREDTLGKTLCRRSDIAAKCWVEFFHFRDFIQSFIIFSLSNSRKSMTFYISCLIKKLCKMPKFAKFMLVTSLFKYSRKNSLDRFLNLLWGMSCLQNIFFNVDF